MDKVTTFNILCVQPAQAAFLDLTQFDSNELAKIAIKSPAFLENADEETIARINTRQWVDILTFQPQLVKRMPLEAVRAMAPTFKDRLVARHRDLEGHLNLIQ